MADMTCQEVDAEMTSFIYGELSGDRRAQVAAHAATCARCQAEIESFSSARMAARRVLDEAPPAGARAAILRAAEAKASAARVARAGDAPAKEATAADLARRGARSRVTAIIDWLRSRWTFPTLATVGAVAIVLLARRVLLDPNKAYDHRPPPAPAAEAAPPPSTSASNEARREQLVAPTDQAEHKKEAGATTAGNGVVAPDRGRPSDVSRRSAGEGRERRERAKAVHRKGAAPSTTDVETAAGVEGGAAAKGSARAEKAVRASNRTYASESLPEEAPVGAIAAAPTAAAAPAAEPRFAPPPPPRVEDQRKPAKQDFVEDDLLGAFAPAGRAADTQAQAQAGSLSKKTRSAPSGPAAPAAPPPTAAPAPFAASAARTSSAASAAGAEVPARAADRAERQAARQSIDVLIARADRLFAERRWADAELAYRELLARYADHRDAARWRQRLIIARKQTETATPPSAPATAAPPR